MTLWVRSAHDLRKARSVRADLSDVVMRAVDVHADIDAPWLFDGESSLRVNGVAVTGSSRPNSTAALPVAPTGGPEIQEVCARPERCSNTLGPPPLKRVAAMPAGIVDVSVNGEWSFAPTLRHLVMATDMWLGRAILGIEQPFHLIGLPNAEYETDGDDMSATNRCSRRHTRRHWAGVGDDKVL